MFTSINAEATQNPLVIATLPALKHGKVLEVMGAFSYGFDTDSVPYVVELVSLSLTIIPVIE
jgi:hypothetical protein